MQTPKKCNGMSGKTKTFMGSKISPRDLGALASEIRDIIASSDDRNQALARVSSVSVEAFGREISPTVLEKPDRLSISFLELLDQIVFEINENQSDSETIKDYIAENLFKRVTIFSEAMTEISAYSRSLQSRPLSVDDTLIISHFRMNEFVPELINEFAENPALQKHILRALLRFNPDETVSFMSEIASGPYCPEARATALASLKKSSAGTEILASLEENGKSSLLRYASLFNAANIPGNIKPYTPETCAFASYLIEADSTLINDIPSLIWFCGIFESFPDAPGNSENPKYSGIFRALTHVLVELPRTLLKDAVKSDIALTALTSFIDSLPRSVFSRIAVALDPLGSSFQNPVGALVESGKIVLDGPSSNTLSYLMRDTASVF